MRFPRRRTKGRGRGRERREKRKGKKEGKIAFLIPQLSPISILVFL